MEIMPSRYTGLQEALEGYERTEVPLVAYDGQNLKPAGFTDDVGLYEIVPRIARVLDLSIDQAIDVFFVGGILTSLAVGLLGCFRCFQSWWLRGWAALLLIVVTHLCLKFGDVYVVPACLAMALVPWYLSFLKEAETRARFLGFSVVCGIALGTGHFVRSHAGTAILLIILITMLTDWKRPRSRRFLVVALVIAGFLLPALHFNRLLTQRDNYLSRHVPGYQEPLRQHPLWHSVYIGLGYLDNDHGIRYQDGVAAAKVQELAPDAGYVSDEYESVLRSEVLRIAREQPLFVIRTVAAKLWALLLVLLLYANAGLPAAFVRPKERSLEIAFWAALAFSALPGMLVMPYAKYVLGFITMAALYGLFGLSQLKGMKLRIRFELPPATRRKAG